MQIRERNEEGMGRGRKNRKKISFKISKPGNKKVSRQEKIGVKGSKSKRSKIPPQSLSFSSSSAPAHLAVRDFAARRSHASS